MTYSYYKIKMNKIDLQIQSTASDGKYAPAKLVEMAKENGLETIAITDHDTVNGVKEAIDKGDELGVRVIPGIEMSVHLDKKELHILGYGIDIENSRLLDNLARFQDDRVRRMQRIIENLQKMGFKITFEDILKQAKGTMARPHVAMAAMANPENKPLLGGIDSVHSFIENYLVPGKPGYADREYVPAKEAIELIHEARGVAVWSHPAIHFDNFDQLEETLRKMISLNIDGLEAFSPSHTKENAEKLLELAKKYELIFTAGSDFHQETPNRETPEGQRPAQTVGDFNTFGYNIDPVIPELDRVIKKQNQTAH